MAYEHTYVQTQGELEACVKALENSDILAIDIECENNLHHYGTYTALIQISSQQQNWLIDVIALNNQIQALAPIFADENIRKVFHDVSFDIRLLNHQFGFDMHNIFDTQLAAQFLGKDKIGLGDLLEEYFELKKVKALQKADWTKRPIIEKMLDYAVMDTAHLLELYSLLVTELKEKGRADWVEEEIAGFSELAKTYKEADHTTIKGYGKMKYESQERCFALYNLREKVAKELNKPNYFIMNNKLLATIAQKPISLMQWKKLRGVHPTVKKRAEEFFAATQLHELPESTKQKRTVKRFSEDQKAFMKHLLDRRETVAAKLNLKPFLLASKDQIQEITATGTYDCLRDWQRELLGEI